MYQWIDLLIIYHNLEDGWNWCIFSEWNLMLEQDQFCKVLWLEFSWKCSSSMCYNTASLVNIIKNHAHANMESSLIVLHSQLVCILCLLKLLKQAVLTHGSSHYQSVEPLYRGGIPFYWAVQKFVTFQLLVAELMYKQALVALHSSHTCSIPIICYWPEVSPVAELSQLCLTWLIM